MSFSTLCNDARKLTLSYLDNRSATCYSTTCKAYGETQAPREQGMREKSRQSPCHYLFLALKSYSPGKTGSIASLISQLDIPSDYRT